MGAVTDSGGGLVWLKLNQSTATMHLAGEKIPGFQSNLMEVDLIHKPAFTDGGKTIPAGWVYRLVFEDDDSGHPIRYGLEMREGNSITNNLINSMLGIPLLSAGQSIYMRLYEKNGNTNLYLADKAKDGEKLPWRHQWVDGWFDGVPRPKETNELDENGNFRKDWRPVTAFWREKFINEIYPAINGKKWEAQRDPDKTAQVKNIIKARALEQSTEKMEAAWGQLVTWIGNQLTSAEDAAEVVAFAKATYQAKGGRKNLADDGTVPTESTEKPAPTPLDDLPF